MIQGFYTNKKIKACMWSKKSKSYCEVDQRSTLRKSSCASTGRAGNNYFSNVDAEISAIIFCESV